MPMRTVTFKMEQDDYRRTERHAKTVPDRSVGKFMRDAILAALPKPTRKPKVLK